MPFAPSDSISAVTVEVKCAPVSARTSSKFELASAIRSRIIETSPPSTRPGADVSIIRAAAGGIVKASSAPPTIRHAASTSEASLARIRPPAAASAGPAEFGESLRGVPGSPGKCGSTSAALRARTSAARSASRLKSPASVAVPISRASRRITIRSCEAVGHVRLQLLDAAGRNVRGVGDTRHAMLGRGAIDLELGEIAFAREHRARLAHELFQFRRRTHRRVIPWLIPRRAAHANAASGRRWTSA